MRALDVFVGLEGWSDGFNREGIETVGVDVERLPFRYHAIVADMNYSPLRGEKLGEYFDVVVGSPPCRDFSKMRYVSVIRNWRNPPDAKRGLDLVYVFLALVAKSGVKYWVMENVPGLCKHLFLKPKCTVQMTKTMRRCLWGKFPAFLVSMELGQPKREMIGGKMRAWLRAKIPLSVSLGLAQAILHDADQLGRN